MTKVRWAILVLVLVILAVGLTWKFHSRVPERNDLGAVFHFHPDAVLKFTWHAGSKEFVFTRPSRNSAWSPSVDPQAIQAKLNIFSTMVLRDVKEKLKGPITFEIEFAPENSWTGVFDGQTFVWTSGPDEGKGATLDETNVRWFLGGKFEFSPIEWNWCPQRPKSVEISMKDHALKLEQIGVKWNLTSKGKTREVDPTLIENWLGHFCSDRIRQTRDLEMFPQGISFSSDKIKIEYTDGTSREMKSADHWITISKDEAITTENFETSIQTLISIPD